MIRSSTLKMPGRDGNLSPNRAATFLSTGRKPYWARSVCAVSPLTNRMKRFATSLFELVFSTAIGSSISIDWRGITYWMSSPLRREVIASLS
jgi:hypothetical protein